MKRSIKWRLNLNSNLPERTLLRVAAEVARLQVFPTPNSCASGYVKSAFRTQRTKNEERSMSTLSRHTVLVLGLIGLCWLPTYVVAQSDLNWEPAPPVAPAPPFPTNRFLFVQEDHKRMSAVEQLWQQADSDDDRRQVKEMIAEIISEEFDVDLKRRQAELDKIVNRVEKLKDQLKRRIQSKDEIVQLQVKQTTMTWDGLGWNGETKDPQRAPIAQSLYSTAKGKLGLAYGWNTQPPRGSLSALVRESALGDQKRLDFLCEQLAKRLEDVSPDTANKTLWYLYEETKDKVDDRGYWSQLIEAGEEAIDRAGKRSVACQRTRYGGSHVRAAGRSRESSRAAKKGGRAAAQQRPDQIVLAAAGSSASA